MKPGYSRLLLGGQKSGKSREAERLARHWLAGMPDRKATLIATATGGDAEMVARIERHRRERALHAFGLATLEAPRALAEAMRELSAHNHLLVVDCLTLWLTNLLMPLQGAPLSPEALEAEIAALEAALAHCPGPVVLVSNEIGWGVIPMGEAVRRFVDAMGGLNHRMAAACTHVSLMAAGLSVELKSKK